MRAQQRLRRCAAVVLLFLGGFVPGARAQWLEQTFHLKQGWNAVYFHVDLTHSTLRDIIDVEANPDTPLEEIWLWTPARESQFTTSPYAAVGTDSQWSSWKRSQPSLSDLQRIPGNSACVIKVSRDTNWKVVGRPVPPAHAWKSNGQNFLGVAVPETSPPTFDGFFARAGLASPLTFYVYGPTSQDPTRLDQTSKSLVRGQAFWVKSDDATFGGYLGPFAVELPGADRIEFGDSVSQARLVLRNRTDSALTLTLALNPSAAAPAGMPAMAGDPPLLVRGVLDTSKLTYAYSRLNVASSTFDLAPKGQPGSEVEVVLGLDRSVMNGAAGSVFGGVLRLTDSLGMSRVEFPVSAIVPATSGLWVGQANLTQVRHALKTYERTDGTLTTTSGGQYVVTGEDTTLGSVARSASLRLIVHSDPTAGAVLLQRVYYGPLPGGRMILATSESLLDPAQLKSARRMSATHLPWSADNYSWPMTGALGVGTNLTATVVLPYDDQASNPFLHTYHPDHDNLDARAQQVLAQGEESYQVTRVMTLSQKPPADDFASLTAGGLRVQGDYDETITIHSKPGESRTFGVRGTYALARVSDIASLSHP